MAFARKFEAQPGQPEKKKPKLEIVKPQAKKEKVPVSRDLQEASDVINRLVESQLRMVTDENLKDVIRNAYSFEIDKRGGEGRALAQSYVDQGMTATQVEQDVARRLTERIEAAMGIGKEQLIPKELLRLTPDKERKTEKTVERNTYYSEAESELNQHVMNPKFKRAVRAKIIDEHFYKLRKNLGKEARLVTIRKHINHEITQYNKEFDQRLQKKRVIEASGVTETAGKRKTETKAHHVDRPFETEAQRAARLDAAKLQGSTSDNKPSFTIKKPPLGDRIKKWFDNLMNPKE